MILPPLPVNLPARQPAPQWGPLNRPWMHTRWAWWTFFAVGMFGAWAMSDCDGTSNTSFVAPASGEQFQITPTGSEKQVGAKSSAIIGHPRVVDGDTLAFGTTKVRLFGIDAFEHKQTCATGQPDSPDFPCGQVAMDAMTKAIGDKDVVCNPISVDRYGRTIAVCRNVDDALDLGAFMVRSGLAFAYDEYSTWYDAEQALAKADGYGAWVSKDVEPPSQWRKEHPQ
jgi:endonuclease YncB( thermonuclease family)